MQPINVPLTDTAAISTVRIKPGLLCLRLNEPTHYFRRAPKIKLNNDSIPNQSFTVTGDRMMMGALLGGLGNERTRASLHRSRHACTGCRFDSPSPSSDGHAGIPIRRAVRLCVCVGVLI